MKKLLVIVTLLTFFGVGKSVAADDSGSVTVTVIPVDFCGPGPATGIVEIRGADHVTGVVDVHMTLGMGHGIVEDVEGTIGEGGPGDYGFHYVDALNETQTVFLSATFQSSLGLYQSEVVSFFLDEFCGLAVVPTGVVEIEAAPVILPPTY